MTEATFEIAHPGAAADELTATLYAELRAIAASYFASQPASHTLQPTALVNEALLKMIRDRHPESAERWKSPGHFLAVAATAMRQILVDYARAKRSLKRGGVGRIAVDATGLAAPVLPDVIELNDAIDRLAVLDERASRVVVLRFFAGLTIAQAAVVLGVSDFTIENDWRAARAFLARELASSSKDAAHERA